MNSEPIRLGSRIRLKNVKEDQILVNCDQKFFLVGDKNGVWWSEGIKKTGTGMGATLDTLAKLASGYEITHINGNEIKNYVQVRLGTKFLNSNSYEKYILARTGDDSVALINLNSGNYFRQPVFVSNIFLVTADEMIKLGITDAWRMIDDE